MTQPDINLKYDALWGDPLVELRTANGAYFSGGFNPNPGNGLPKSVVFYKMFVPEGDRRNGIATGLTAKMAEIALENGAECLIGSVESQHMVRIFRKLAGDDNLDFADFDPDLAETRRLPLTAEQAIGSLERAEAFEVDLNNREFGIDIDVRLR